ncbi:membrane fusion protein (multidrug efflux system) [Rhodoblastus acidophilus]|uniref:efflux RND transporter periplasmic adaptor subunit n=1 Tax=Rhodoblastus acidophilus TaxID=1074 RepID=UPI00160C5814|nr:efflux RND transporter periplasmic adaptor subunit [Rhodoblastus acidophilus]MCW2283524.1 membrane fusion protein (multidrug efflux system) [Rhodoblastus acidophilus]MCW2332384.1 membrane fusion protein (multidrug efflux system) [Rhodoblastus acidophilus]
MDKRIENTLLPRFAGLRGALCAVALLMGSGASAQQGQPIPVGVTKIALTPVEQAVEFVGRVSAIERVEVRARVKGFLEAVLFKEGDEIKKGAPLYRIEKGQFDADVKQAEGALLRSKAAKELSVIQLKRADELLAKQTGTAVARDQAQAADQQALGQIVSNEGALELAKLNLSYTEITAPIAGKIGATNVTVGNVVGPDSGVLTTIVSQNPMYVKFPVSEREFLKMRRDGSSAPREKLKVGIKFADGSLYDQNGELNFVDVSVDKATDTINVRGSFPNPNGVLVDGQFVRVVLQGDKPEEKLVVPQAALLADQKGMYVFVVQDDKAEVRRITTGGGFKDSLIVEDGLKAGDLVIVDGLQGVRPGAPVRARPAVNAMGTN